MTQARDDALTGRLVPVHIADHEHADGGGPVSDTVRHDRAVLDGVTDDHDRDVGTPNGC